MSVIKRAREILAHHETFVPKEAPVQIRLFEPVNHELADRIRNLKLDELRPIEALQLLSDLQKELRLRRHEIAIVFITAQADETVRSHLLNQGAVECLSKPFSDAALLKALNTAFKVS